MTDLFFGELKSVDVCKASKKTWRPGPNPLIHGAGVTIGNDEKSYPGAF
jgi:hypothetical protein